MTGKNARQKAILRQVSGKAATFVSEVQHSLLPSQEVVVGRDPSCQVVLDAMRYRMVSRRHAVVRPLSSSPDAACTWVICDLNSANGTYLNGQRLQGCQQLMPGDRINLGLDGPEFIFEYEINYQNTLISSAGAGPLPPANQYQTPTAHFNPGPAPSQDYLSFTQLFPIISTGKDLTRRVRSADGSGAKILLKPCGTRNSAIFLECSFSTPTHPRIRGRKSCLCVKAYRIRR
ncbi:hypothetical protein NUACC21_16340 [Scytonema sp. NUACC21]